ncbi:unnamed protein product [Psylliodes chrysocephalus]|uniref:Regulatory protein zeste n=1 Tax=Psylliodes chrysocephalus TaxID=3402493 RepID=A0A9P0CY16_9CUCU|nr:unnamed protein product [Psylliodes chrysocephala]
MCFCKKRGIKKLRFQLTMNTQPKRGSNFSKDEEYLLISLVAKYKSIIELKATNAVTWKKKHNKWIQIEKEFNSNCGLNGRKSVKMLKEKYINLKKKTKKKISKNKLNINLTGGGPITQEVLSEVDAAISDLLEQQVTGLPSIFDSDKDIISHSQNDVS